MTNRDIKAEFVRDAKISFEAAVSIATKIDGNELKFTLNELIEIYSDLNYAKCLLEYATKILAVDCIDLAATYEELA